MYPLKVYHPDDPPRPSLGLVIMMMMVVVVMVVVMMMMMMFCFHFVTIKDHFL